MPEPDIKVKAAWRSNLVRALRNNTKRSLTATARSLGVGRARIHQEFRRDPQFQAEIEEILGHSVDSKMTSTW